MSNMVNMCSYELLIDGEEKKSGSILEDFDPAVNPPEEIDDPEDSKPEDWVDTPKYVINPRLLKLAQHHAVQHNLFGLQTMQTKAHVCSMRNE